MSDLEHVDVVVGFKKQDVGIFEALLCVFVIAAQVCADAGLFLSLIDSVADRVRGIMGDMHGVDFEISHRDGFVGFYTDKSVRIDVLKFWHLSH